MYCRNIYLIVLFDFKIIRLTGVIILKSDKIDNESNPNQCLSLCCLTLFWHFLLKQNFPTLCVPPEAMVPKVLINPQFSFGEISKTAIEMKENLDNICKTELSKISKIGKKLHLN